MTTLDHLTTTALRAELPDGRYLTHWSYAWITRRTARDPERVASVRDKHVGGNLDRLDAGPDRVFAVIDQARAAECVAILNDRIAPSLRGVVRPFTVPNLGDYLLLAGGAHVSTEHLTDRDMLAPLLPVRVSA